MLSLEVMEAFISEEPDFRRDDVCDTLFLAIQVSDQYEEHNTGSLQMATALRRQATHPMPLAPCNPTRLREETAGGGCRPLCRLLKSDRTLPWTVILLPWVLQSFPDRAHTQLTRQCGHRKLAGE